LIALPPRAFHLRHQRLAFRQAVLHLGELPAQILLLPRQLLG